MRIALTVTIDLTAAEFAAAIDALEVPDDCTCRAALEDSASRWAQQLIRVSLDDWKACFQRPNRPNTNGGTR